MKRGWSILAWSNEGVTVRFTDGRVEEIRTDGRSGSGLAEEYIEAMSLHHSGQLRAADGILQRMLGSKYAVVRSFKRIYQAHLTVVSMGCAFGPATDHPHFDGKGRFRFGYSPCPVRAVCPFNGYHSNGNKEGCYGCNPIYETGLTARQTEVADLLVNTPFSLLEIAERIHLDEGRVRNIASEVYAKMGVRNRQELAYALRGKRLK